MPAVLRYAAAVAVAALGLAGAAHAATVEVVVVPDLLSPKDYAYRGAVGLMTVGAGPTVSREAALAALVRGQVESSLIGGMPGGKPLIRLGARKNADVSIFLSLPPAGKRANDRRYPIVIVGGGHRGLLTSPSTRIPGLVSIADVAPTAVALANGKKPRIQWTDGSAADLRDLDRRLARELDGRDGAAAILALSALAFALLALALSSPRLARAALLAAPLTVALAITLSALDVTRPSVLLPLLALLTVGLSIAGGALLDARGIAALFVALIAAYLVVLAARPSWPALAAIGPNPGGGSRFYGSGNLTTAVLLTIALFAAATLGRKSVAPIGLLALVTVGWSKAGADGGGILVLVCAFVTLGIRLRTGRLTARTVAAAAAIAVAVGLALVGIDAAAGGESHVTRRVGDGPGAVLGDLGQRLHISVESLGVSWHGTLVFGAALAALVILALRPPRFPAGDALLVGTAVSLLVNDSPQNVAAAAAISYGVLWVHERVGLSDRPRPR